MQNIDELTTPSKKDEPLQHGWAIVDDETLAPGPRALTDAPPSARMSTEEIDDGWVLPAEEPAAPATLTADESPAADGRLDLNAATVEALCEVPGIGPAKARRILDLRERLGGFTEVGQLDAVRGIGGRTLEELRDRLRT